LLKDAQHLHHLNTLTDTIRWWLVTSTRWCVNTWGYRLLKGTMTYIWKCHKCQQYHYYVGRTGYHRSNNTSKPTWYNTAW
jgi:hypothetical protein